MEIINPNGKKTVRVSTEWLGRELTLEVNRVGFRTTSSVLVTYGDTVVLTTITYMSALGMTVQVEVIMPIFMGLLLTIIGNYLPKCKRNYTIGIKLPWTLDSEENWNKTHRLAGWTWTIGGILIMATGWLCGFVAFIIVLSAMVLTPIIYSYILHKKGI